MSKFLLAALIMYILLSITTPFTVASPFVRRSSLQSTPGASAFQKRCLLGRFACFGQTAEPIYRISHAVPYVRVAASQPENIILHNNNKVNIAPPVVPAYEDETSTVTMIFTEMAPVTFVSSVTEINMATQTLPAETVIVSNFETVTELETASVTEIMMATETLPAEIETVNNFVTEIDQETVSMTESDFATQTLPAETVVVSNFMTLTEMETASVTESVFATQTLPAETIVSNSDVTITEETTVSMTEIETATQILPAETVKVNNFYTVTELQTTSVIALAVPSPTPETVIIDARVPVAAPCEACEETPVCVHEDTSCA